MDVNEGDTSHTSRTQVSTKSPPSLHQVSTKHPPQVSPTPTVSHPHLSPASAAPICRMHPPLPFVACICRPHLSHAPHAPCALLLDSLFSFNLFADAPPFPHMSHPVSPICQKLILLLEACATLLSSGSSLAADPRARAVTHPGTEQTLSQATLTLRTPWESCTSSGGTDTREMLSRERTGRLLRPSRATRWRSRGSGGCFLQGRESHVTLHKGSGKSHEFLSHVSHLEPHMSHMKPNFSPNPIPHKTQISHLTRVLT